jgi:murein DD-endopeptidase MepM/ murein hydrolase activator NlpD
VKPGALDFGWPVFPGENTLGHYGACADWPGDPDGCYWLSDATEEQTIVWRDAQPFQLHDSVFGFHLGADYNLGSGDEDLGKPVYPTAAGTIVEVLENQCGWGNIVFVRHDTDGEVFTSMYAHVDWLATGAPIAGTAVDRSIPIALIGKGAWNNASCSGATSGSYPAHLHFEIREGLNMTPGPAYTATGVSIRPQGQIDPNEFIATH